ncbi:hypothetical protein L1049_025938 [Liquidambar formosana]|uniref:DUF7950 domain-containing protein n=1 Tax=Liquidambar formosana TaxID=63359 RepID=A0AAP0R6T9_LIQFO
MMIQPMNPHSASKTAEIMSRYRPIAPKPELPVNPLFESSSSISPKIRQSPYLRNVWPQMQARPTRTRKRNRTAISPATLKRTRTHLFGFSSPCHVTSSAAKNMSLHGFAHGSPQLPLPNLAAAAAALNASLEKTGTSPESLVTLPLLPYPPSVPAVVANQAVVQELKSMKSCEGEKMIDLNTVAEIPEERDLLLQLRGPTNTNVKAPQPSNVIAPQPVRPIGSSISVGCINEDTGSIQRVQAPKKPEEVEEEVESEALPAVISDSNNKVRLANSAYKVMVGQPECSWLDSMVTCDGRVGSACKRISGEVMLRLSDSRMPVSSKGFSCWVNIEWGSDGKKSSINAFCDVMRLSCESKDYLFTWRFHTQTPEASQSSP